MKPIHDIRGHSDGCRVWQDRFRGYNCGGTLCDRYAYDSCVGACQSRSRARPEGGNVALNAIRDDWTQGIRQMGVRRGDGQTCKDDSTANTHRMKPAHSCWLVCVCCRKLSQPLVERGWALMYLYPLLDARPQAPCPHLFKATLCRMWHSIETTCMPDSMHSNDRRR